METKTAFENENQISKIDWFWSLIGEGLQKLLSARPEALPGIENRPLVKQQREWVGFLRSARIWNPVRDISRLETAFNVLQESTGKASPKKLLENLPPFPRQRALVVQGNRAFEIPLGEEHPDAVTINENGTSQKPDAIDRKDAHKKIREIQQGLTT